MKINKINNKNICIKRRRKGEFFTPTIWVDEAHKMIEENLGKDWKEKYIVWDPAWGTGNLTRDYKFKELYCSTIEASDIHTANQMGYNPEATKFQFDFLNDDDSKLPQSLQDAINSSKEILFLINPPYATANNMGTKENDHKKGVATNNKISEEMKKNDWGASSQNLYAQFLYKITQYQKTNNNIKIGIFCPPLFLSGGSYKKFRKEFFKEFGFEKGFLFEACHFSDVAKNWGISFTLFNSIKNKNDFNLDIIDLNKNFELEIKGVKKIYNVDNKIPCSDWVRQEIKGLKTFDAPQLTNALKIKCDGKTMRGTIANNGFGFFLNANNNVYVNTTQVSFFTSPCSKGNGFSIIKENIYKSTLLFTARKTIQPNWINCKDEYLAPNEEHPKFEQFKYDSLVYSLFNNSSQQSSLRQVEYKDKLWDIKNEFFWLSAEKMKMLAEENSFDALYKDARTSNERYVYELLFGEQDIYNKLSPDAKAVLDAATALLEKSMSMRKAMSEGKPEYHLQTWDAGYAQLKLVWKQYFKNEFDAFRKLYKQFEDRMRPLVYELGFLLGDDNIIK